MNENISIRPCRSGDAETLVAMVRELAVFERLERFARATPERFRADLFGARPFAEVWLAEIGGRPAGFALAFTTYSTFRAAPSLYLEDLFVRPEHRGQGIGKALLATAARHAIELGCGRLEWSVLDWNEQAISFYRAQGARPMDEWTVYRLDDEPLRRLAQSAPTISGERPIG